MAVDAGDEFSNWIYQITSNTARSLVQEARYRSRSQRWAGQDHAGDAQHARIDKNAQKGPQPRTEALHDSGRFTTRDSRESVAEQYAEAFEKMGVAKPEAAEDAVWYSEFLSAYSQALNGGVSLYNLEHDASDREKLYTAIFTGHAEDGDIITEVQMQGPNSAYEDAVAIRQKAAVAAALTMRDQDIQYEIKGLDQEEIRTAAKTVAEHQRDQLGDDVYGQLIEQAAFAEQPDGSLAASVRPCDAELMTTAVGAAAAVKLQEKASLIDLTPQELEAALDAGVLREVGQEQVQQREKAPMSVRDKGIEKEPMPVYTQGRDAGEPGDREPVRAPDDASGARGVAHDAVMVRSGSKKNVTVAQVWCKASEREAILQQLKQIGVKPKETDRGEVEISKEGAQMDASSFEAAEYVTEKGHVGQEETERMPRTGREER